MDGSIAGLRLSERWQRGSLYLSVRKMYVHCVIRFPVPVAEVTLITLTHLSHTQYIYARLTSTYGDRFVPPALPNRMSSLC